jgi:hypothetical protein
MPPTGDLEKLLTPSISPDKQDEFDNDVQETYPPPKPTPPPSYIHQTTYREPLVGSKEEIKHEYLRRKPIDSAVATGKKDRTKRTAKKTMAQQRQEDAAAKMSSGTHRKMKSGVGGKNAGTIDVPDDVIQSMVKDVVQRDIVITNMSPPRKHRHSLSMGAEADRVNNSMETLSLNDEVIVSRNDEDAEGGEEDVMVNAGAIDVIGNELSELLNLTVFSSSKDAPYYEGPSDIDSAFSKL